MSFEQSVHGTRRWSLRNFAQRYCNAYILGAPHPNAILSFEIIWTKSVFRNSWSEEERRWAQEKHLFFHCYLQGMLLLKLFLYICGIYNGTVALQTCCMDVSRVAFAWRECDSNQQRATQPGGRTETQVSQFQNLIILATWRRLVLLRCCSVHEQYYIDWSTCHALIVYLRFEFIWAVSRQSATLCFPLYENIYSRTQLQRHERERILCRYKQVLL
jgi:hypothetical protein